MRAALLLFLAGCNVLTEQAINVDLKPLNEQAPKSAGPMGRLARIENGIASKFLGDSLRASKRPGFTSLSATTFANGVQQPAPEDPKLLASWQDQLVLIGGTTPYVRSEARDRWERASSVYASAPSVGLQTITKKPLYNASSIAYGPDVAAVGNVLCYVVADDILGNLITLVDVDGTQIKAPFTAAGSNAKVVSDGSRFWVFAESGTSTSVKVIDTDGATLATGSFPWGIVRTLWDIGYQPVTGRVYLVTSTGATTTIFYSFYNAGSITSSAALTPAIDSSGGVARLENTEGGTNIYIAATNAFFDVVPFEITSTGTIGHTYDTAAATATGVYNVTGFVSNSSFDLTVAVSVLANNTVTPSLSALYNMILIARVARAGGSSTVTQRALGLVSRAYVDDIGTWRVIAYYQGSACYAIAGTVRDVSALGAEPTFFILDLSALVPGVTGQFDTGFAYAYYATSRNSVVFTPWHLSSVAEDANAVQHVPLGYLATQTAIPGGGFSSVTGIEDVRLSPKVGRALSTSGALLLPGLQATAFDGTSVTEQGMQLAPVIISVSQTSGGSLTPDEYYTYVAVYEWVDALGERHQSALSEPVRQGMGPTDNRAVVVISTLRTTIKPNVTIALYRTFSPTLAGTTEGVILRRVGSVANTILGNTQSITDDVSDVSAALGEECYSQVLDTSAPPALDFFPMPAFSKGVNFDGRAFVIGYDNAIWFSFQKVEGQGLATNPYFRVVLPTPATPVDIVALDARIAVFCDDGTQWSFPGGNFPNANATTGAIPTPEQNAASTGASSSAALTPLGAIYGAASGVWLMDRGLSSRFIGAPVLDELTTARKVIGIDVDLNQRIYFTLGTDGEAGTVETVLVFDLISSAWYVWLVPGAVFAQTTWKGYFAFADGAGVVHVLDPDDDTDFTDDGDAILSVYELASIDFAGVNGYEACWQVQFFGAYFGPHQLTIETKLDQSDSVEEAFIQNISTDPGIYRFEVMPKRPDCQAIALTFADSFSFPVLATLDSSTGAGPYDLTLTDAGDLALFAVGSTYVSSQDGETLDAGSFTVLSIGPDSMAVTANLGWVPVAAQTYYTNTEAIVPGNSFALETVGFLVGVESGLGRISPTTRRIAP